ncbi:MAG: hypothetical protein WCD56_12470, partial [Pseudolabrys sp.]
FIVVAFWGPESAYTELWLVGLPSRHWRLAQHKVDDIHDGAEVRGIDVVAVKSEPAEFFYVKY